MVSASQRIAASTTDARHRPGAARFIVGPELRRRADRRPGRRRPGHVEQEKNSIFLIAENQPQRSRQSRPRVLCAPRQRAERSGEPLRTAQRRLCGVSRARDAGSASILCFQQVYAAATLVTPAATGHTPFRPELAHSTRVDACKHVNPSVGAVSGCRALTPCTFPQSYRPVTLQLPFGGDVSASSRRCAAASPFGMIARTRNWGRQGDQ